MVLLIVALGILAALYGPQWWARHTLLTYNRTDYFSGTGLEFARLLVERLGLEGVRVEEHPTSSHYDPEQRVVAMESRLAKRKTLSAVVVAAHEVGHAQQHAQGFPAFEARGRLVLLGAQVEKIGYLAFIILPLVAVLLRIPAVGAIMLFFAGGVLIMPVCIHLLTLPVEMDASFNRALPILRSGPYIPDDDYPAARQILTACSLTYVAAALAGFLNVWRWLRFLRR